MRNDERTRMKDDCLFHLGEMRKMVSLPLVTRSYFMSVPVFLCRSGYGEGSNGLKMGPINPMSLSQKLPIQEYCDQH